jgi:integrase
MGHRFNERTGFWEASAHGRHPVTNIPVSLRLTKIDTEKEALKAEADLNGQLKIKLRRMKAPMWSTLMDKAITQRLNDGRWSEGTADNARVLLRAVTNQEWAYRTIDTISTGEIRELLNEKLKERSQTHKASVAKYIKAVFEYAVENGILPNNPCPRIKYKDNDKIQGVLKMDEVALLLRRAFEENHPHKWLWVLAIYTGMRNGELMALEWTDIDIENRTIKITKSFSKRSSGNKSTKSGDERNAEIAEELVPYLLKLKEKQGQDKLVLPRDRNWLKGEQARVLKGFLYKIGLPEVRFHDLRASWATAVLKSGANLGQLQSMGGWRDTKTLRKYIRKAALDVKGTTANLKILDSANVIVSPRIG